MRGHAHTYFMKKIKFLLLFSVLLLLVPVNPTEAATKKTAVGVSSAFVERTGSANLTVFISSDEKIAGGSFDILYNPDNMRISATDVKMTDTLADYLSSGGSDGAGKISMSFAKSSGSTIDGTIMEVKATVLTPGSGKINDLKLENVELYNEQGTKINAQLISGQLRPFDGKESTYDGTVAVDKSWVITLSKAYNPATLNASAVSVKRSNTAFPVEVEAISDTQFRVKPMQPYLKYTYTLEVTDQLRSVNGAKLSQPVRLTFKVN
ncbi:hypothetical protein CSV63_13880 [Sporosarcina sp. P34]|uniref:cohesin domain-containing protein n=1 Tax=Sporosarcina sp. P34 TaxID=2048247 RepID=UPI000C16DCA9|nr:cohesin domain-containing protein [Sporosarcina sp. P34]PID14175.1 hypothetical protein CSV63_13880 [Sporosarcina sp. P34]